MFRAGLRYDFDEPFSVPVGKRFFLLVERADPILQKRKKETE
jgi:hypothetical protein